MQANKRTFNIEKDILCITLKNREMEQRLMFLTELVEKLLLTRSSYEMRNPKQEAK